MLYSFVIFLLLNTASVYLVNQLLDGFVVTGGILGFVLVGIVIGILNSFLRPILKILSLPFIFLTAGLFVIFINAGILWFAQEVLLWLKIDSVLLTITGVGSYIASVILLGVSNYFFQKLLR